MSNKMRPKFSHISEKFEHASKLKFFPFLSLSTASLVLAWGWCHWSYSYAASHSSPSLTRWLSQHTGAFDAASSLYQWLAVISSIVICLSALNSFKLATRNRVKKIERSILPPFPDSSRELGITIAELHNRKTGQQIEKPSWLRLEGDGLFGSTLVLGRPGTGKTSSLILPAAEELLEYRKSDQQHRIGGLVLDVKGNLWNRIRLLAENAGRGDDCVTVRLAGEVRYNPIHYPNLSPEQLADELMQTIAILNKGKTGGDAFWLDKARSVIAHGLGLLRGSLGYVTLHEVHMLFSDDSEVDQAVEVAESMVDQLPSDQAKDLQYRIDFFAGKEWRELDSKIKGIIDSEAKRVLEPFSLPEMRETFCCSEEDLNFDGFDSIWSHGKLIGLSMSKSTHGAAAQAVGALMKIAFQRSMLSRPSRCQADPDLNFDRPVALVIDECQEIITGFGQNGGDPGFFALSRESKCIGFLASQSFAGIRRALGDQESSLQELNGAIVNKIFFALGDEKSAQTAADLAGKAWTPVKQISTNENMEGARYNLAAGKHLGDRTDLSTSVGWQDQKEHVFGPEKFMYLSRNQAICLLSNGKESLPPSLAYTKPFYQDRCRSWFDYNQKAAQDQSFQKREAI